MSEQKGPERTGGRASRKEWEPLGQRATPRVLVSKSGGCPNPIPESLIKRALRWIRGKFKRTETETAKPMTDSQMPAPLRARIEAETRAVQEIVSGLGKGLRHPLTLVELRALLDTALRRADQSIQALRSKGR